jgi:hypothetical protein
MHGFLNPDPGIAESGLRVCCSQIQALLNPDLGFAELRPDFAEHGFSTGIYTKKLNIFKICFLEPITFSLHPINMKN